LPTDDSLAAVANQIEASFTSTLIKELRTTPFPVESAGEAVAEAPFHTLIVHGEFTSVDEGNRSQRIMIGFGKGASDVRTHVIVSLRADTQTIVVADFMVKTSSGKTPGAAATMGVGTAATAAASAAAHGAGDKKSTVTADASRMGKAVAKQIIKAMAAQQWISPDPKKSEESHEKHN